METLDIEYACVFGNIGKHHKTKRRIWLNSAFQDGRHIKLQILAIGMHTCVTMDGYRFPMLSKKLLNYSKGIDRSQRTKYYLKELHTAML